MIDGVTRHTLPHLFRVPHLHVNRPQFSRKQLNLFKWCVHVHRTFYTWPAMSLAILLEQRKVFTLETPTCPPRFIVLKHQFGGRVLLTLYNHTFTPLVCHAVGQGDSFTTRALEVEFCSFAAHLHALARPPVTPATAAQTCEGLYFCEAT